MKAYIIYNTNLGKLNIKRLFYLKKNPLPERHQGQWDTIIIHHTGRTLPSILDLHLNKNKWFRIGYHFVISQKGEIIQTRSLNRRGGHAYFYNQRAIGIAFLKELNKGKLTKKMRETCLRLILELKKIYPIKKRRF